MSQSTIGAPIRLRPEISHSRCLDFMSLGRRPGLSGLSLKGMSFMTFLTSLFPWHVKARWCFGACFPIAILMPTRCTGAPNRLFSSTYDNTTKSHMTPLRDSHCVQQASKSFEPVFEEWLDSFIAKSISNCKSPNCPKSAASVLQLLKGSRW